MKDEIIRFLESKGVSVIKESDRVNVKLDVWEQWYKGHVDKFHEYKVYTGKRKINKERKSLNMAQVVCQQWADLLLNEKVEINCEDDYTEEKLHDLLKQVNFYVRGNNLIERSFALGGGFFIQYWDGEKTAQKYVSQEYMYPISYDSGRLTEACFATQIYIDGKAYTYIECHTLDEKKEYVVDNFILGTVGELGNKISTGSEMPAEFYEAHDILQRWETHSKQPLFQMIRPNIANKDDFNSAYGTSVFNGAIDRLQAIDVIFDSYYKEFLLGKKRIFVQDGVANFNIDGEGNQVPVFDPQDEVFYSLPYDKDDGSTPIHESALSLRVSEHDAALQTQLNLLSQAVGLGANAFKWNDGNFATATQVMSANSQMFRAMKKHEIILNDAIIDMCKGLLFVEQNEGGDRRIKLDADISVNFDDSIIEDTAAVKAQAMQEYSAGLIDAIAYYCDVYKMTEDQAKKYLDEMKARAPQPVEEVELE